MIRSGLPTKLIIPLLKGERSADEDLIGAFAAELSRLDSRIKCMTMSRDAVANHLRRLNLSSS